MLVIRTSDPDGSSYGGFQWPTEGHVETPDWNPAPVCGQGLHGCRTQDDPEYLNWTNPTARWQLVKVNPSEVVDLDGKIKFPRGEVVYSGGRDEALKVFFGTDDTREASLKNPYWAYMYAQYVDKVPRDETRQGASKDPEWAYYYACWVEPMANK